MIQFKVEIAEKISKVTGIEKEEIEGYIEIPKDDNIGHVIITRNYIEGTGGPIIEIRGNTLALEEKKKLPQGEN